MLEPTPLYGGNAEFLDALYEDYLTDPARVPDGWRRYFAQLTPPGGERAHGPLRAAIAQRAAAAAASGTLPGSVANSAKQAAVSRLIEVWNNRGHLLANIDPLGLMPRPRPQVLDLEYFGLSAADLDTEFFTGSRTAAVPTRLPLRDILAQLQFIYAGTVGAEFAHMSDSEERLWRQDEFQKGLVLSRSRAAGRVPGRPSAPSLQCRRAAQHPVAADRRRGARALPAHALRRAEALLARGRGCAHPAAR